MPDANPDVIAEFQHVSFTHSSQTEPALQDISLKIQRGTLNVLVGPGGSGKSTLCDLFNGKIPHLLEGTLTGDVWIDQVNTRQSQVKDLARKVGYVFQDPETMFATLYVEDEIAFGPENLRIEAGAIRQTVQNLLEQTQLLPLRKNLVWNLSGGQVQKLGLAVVLAMDPELVILDEPTANLDPVATQSVHELVLALRQQGKAILLVARELDEFLASADQLLILENGRLLASGPVQQVLQGHGEYMLKSLGIWLPETTEIGIELEQSQRCKVGCVPITVNDLLVLLKEQGGLQAGLTGKPIKPVLQVNPETLITARHLSFNYGGENYALRDVSLDIRAGEMLAIVGRNGAGKSTLAKLLSGLLKPQQGDLTLFGKSAKKWKVQNLANSLALVFQNPEHQFLTDTVADEIGYSLLARGIVDPQERDQIVHDQMELFGLSAVAQRHPFALSAGMKRRLGVATMLVGDPKVLIVDEPTYGQDKQMTLTLMSVMEDIRARGIAVVMITHDMRLVQEYAGRVVVMSNGEVLYDGDPATLFNRKDTLMAANLRPTTLHELLWQIQSEGITIEGEIRTTSDFLEALPAEFGATEAYGR
jgi:energy-coupling factor transport system ATP-binding protein